jgi:branched-chain amino acid transport system permease protein
MTIAPRNVLLFGTVFALLALVGFLQSWNVALGIMNLCLISAVMALGVNIQWGYAGLLNVGVMGFAALGGLAGILIAMPPVEGAWSAGGTGILVSLMLFVATIAVFVLLWKFLGRNNPWRWPASAVIGIVGYFLVRAFFDPAVDAIEGFESAKSGYLGGLGFPIVISWLVGGFFAAAVAWVIGKVALGLRSDYLAIATLGISEIIIAILKNEDWLTRGVKNVTGIPRPVPYEVDLQQEAWVQNLAVDIGTTTAEMSSLIVKANYAVLFTIVLLIVLFLSEKALRSPWGRMMRAIRDNEEAAEAMGKDVTRRHLQVFVLGGAVIGIAGAMLTTLDGQFTPASYQPLRFTFLIWVMVIVGGSGNNWGAVLGGFVIWFFWIEAEPMGLWFIDTVTSGLAEDNWLRGHLIENAAHTRLMMMGAVLLLVLRFSPRGLIPEVRR